MMTTGEPPEYNAVGLDYSRRTHLTYTETPIIDIHAHVTTTTQGEGEAPSTDQAGRMLAIADEFGIRTTLTMCPVQDIPRLRERFGSKLLFNGSISKKPTDADEVAYRLLDDFLAQEIRVIKIWSAPRGRDRGLTVDAPWRIEAVRRARAAGVRTVMAHIADPDHWWTTTYTDLAKFGTKAEQYVPFRRMLELFADVNWIAAHMGGDPEHPDHLEALLEAYPHLHFDTSATKWQVREVSKHPEAIRSLIERRPERFLFGSDLVTRPGLVDEHYISRYWCQRTLWESDWVGRSPIADPDFVATADGARTPLLHGVGLPTPVLRQVYFANAVRLLGLTDSGA